MANEFEQAFCDVHEHNFLIFFLVVQARLDRPGEVFHALNRLASLIAVLVEDRIDISLWLRLLDLVLNL